MIGNVYWYGGDKIEVLLVIIDCVICLLVEDNGFGIFVFVCDEVIKLFICFDFV